MSRVWIKLFLVMIFVVLMLLPPIALAAEKSPPVLTISADDQYQFADQYFEKGEYQPSIHEYKRFIHFFPNDDRLFKARYRIGIAFMRQGAYAKAIEAFGELLRHHQDDEAVRKAYLMISRCHLKRQAFDQALAALANLAAKSAKIETKDVAYYETGWVYITMADWKAARAAFDRISPKNRARYRLARLAQELTPEPEIETKHPRLAGFLALLPGAGYLYTERPHDALVAFGINAGWMLAAYTSFDNDNAPLGVLISAIGLGFYTGSIYGSINSAHKFNKHKKETFIQKLKNRHHITLSARPTKGGGLLALQFRF